MGSCWILVGLLFITNNRSHVSQAFSCHERSAQSSMGWRVHMLWKLLKWHQSLIANACDSTATGSRPLEIDLGWQDCIAHVHISVAGPSSILAVGFAPTFCHLMTVTRCFQYQRACKISHPGKLWGSTAETSNTGWWETLLRLGTVNWHSALSWTWFQSTLSGCKCVCVWRIEITRTIIRIYIYYICHIRYDMTWFKIYCT